MMKSALVMISVPRVRCSRKGVYGLVAENIAYMDGWRMKRIGYSPAAVKRLARLQPKRNAAIIAKLEAYALGAVVDIRKMKGSEFHRMRVGQDRVIIDDKGMVVMVIDAGPRGGTSKE
ncbi:type II toxin-antitoxin system RelE family toxin [Ensifer soli]|uniref:type II toxin-antitoxin system RelE family toxin n=1 Tax=Ciceribacter sp. sgz301302 TaxID=3342379 RepID=UPI0035B8EBCD